MGDTAKPHPKFKLIVLRRCFAKVCVRLLSKGMKGYIEARDRLDIPPLGPDALGQNRWLYVRKSQQHQYAGH
jgi:hypothetical protein